MRGNKPGTKGANWPEAERGTKKVGWRVRPELAAEVKAVGAAEHEPEGLVADVLLTIGLRHREEFRAELQARREGVDKRSTEP